MSGFDPTPRSDRTSGPRSTRRSRRALLAAAAAAATAGCTEYVPRSGTYCTTGADGEFDDDLVGLASVGSTTNNVNSGGTCTRWSSHVCLETSLQFRSERVARVEVRTPDEEVVRTVPVENGSVDDLQLAETERGPRVERAVVLLDSDGEELDRIVAHTQCR